MVNARAISPGVIAAAEAAERGAAAGETGAGIALRRGREGRRSSPAGGITQPARRRSSSSSSRVQPHPQRQQEEQYQQQHQQEQHQQEQRRRSRDASYNHNITSSGSGSPRVSGGRRVSIGSAASISPLQPDLEQGEQGAHNQANLPGANSPSSSRRSSWDFGFGDRSRRRRSSSVSLRKIHVCPAGASEGEEEDAESSLSFAAPGAAAAAAALGGDRGGSERKTSFGTDVSPWLRRSFVSHRPQEDIEHQQQGLLQHEEGLGGRQRRRSSELAGQARLHHMMTRSPQPGADEHKTPEMSPRGGGKGSKSSGARTMPRPVPSSSRRTTPRPANKGGGGGTASRMKNTNKLSIEITPTRPGEAPKWREMSPNSALSIVGVNPPVSPASQRYMTRNRRRDVRSHVLTNMMYVNLVLATVMAVLYIAGPSYPGHIGTADQLFTGSERRRALRSLLSVDSPMYDSRCPSSEMESAALSILNSGLIAAIILWMTQPCAAYSIAAKVGRSGISCTLLASFVSTLVTGGCLVVVVLDLDYVTGCCAVLEDNCQQSNLCTSRVEACCVDDDVVSYCNAPEYNLATMCMMALLFLSTMCMSIMSCTVFCRCWRDSDPEKQAMMMILSDPSYTPVGSPTGTGTGSFTPRNLSPRGGVQHQHASSPTTAWQQQTQTLLGGQQQGSLRAGSPQDHRSSPGTGTTSGSASGGRGGAGLFSAKGKAAAAAALAAAAAGGTSVDDEEPQAPPSPSGASGGDTLSVRRGSRRASRGASGEQEGQRDSYNYSASGGGGGSESQSPVPQRKRKGSVYLKDGDEYAGPHTGAQADKGGTIAQQMAEAVRRAEAAAHKAEARA